MSHATTTETTTNDAVATQRLSLAQLLARSMDDVIETVEEPADEDEGSSGG